MRCAAAVPRQPLLLHHPLTLAAALATALLAVPSAAAGSPIPVPAAGGSDDVDPETDMLEMLWSGTDEERLAAAIDFSFWDPDAATPAEADEARRRVRLVLDAESDPWIRFLAINDLAEYGDPWAGPLLVELLREGRPTDLWPALVWLSDVDEGPEALDALRALWPARDRPWLRPLLAQALATHGAAEMRPELEALARETGPRDIELAEAALDAVIRLEDPASIPLLIEIARRGRPFGATAASALGQWPEHPLTGPALVELAGHRRAEIRRAALRQLGKVAGDDSLQARLARAGDELEEESVRRAALSSLGDESDPLVLDLVSRILLDGDPRPHALEQEARKLLWDLSYGNDAAWSLHQSLFPPVPPPAIIRACSGTVSLELPAGIDLRVTPADGVSTRCWSGPDRPRPFAGNRILDDGFVPRLAGGAAVRIDSVFESGGEIWARVALEECWVPMDLLAWRDLEPAEAERPWTWELSAATAILEFDIPLHEADTSALDTLLAAGLVSLIDPGPGVIGASLDPDVASPRHRDLLRRLAEAGDAPLFLQGLEKALEELEDAPGMDTPPEE